MESAEGVAMETPHIMIVITMVFQQQMEWAQPNRSCMMASRPFHRLKAHYTHHPLCHRLVSSSLNTICSIFYFPFLFCCCWKKIKRTLIISWTKNDVLNRVPGQYKTNWVLFNWAIKFRERERKACEKSFIEKW